MKENKCKARGGRGDSSHHGGAHIAGGYHSLSLAFHGLGEEAEGFFDLALLLRGYVVFFCEPRLARFGWDGVGGGSGTSLGRLDGGGLAMLACLRLRFQVSRKVVHDLPLLFLVLD